MSWTPVFRQEVRGMTRRIALTALVVVSLIGAAPAGSVPGNLRYSTSTSRSPALTLEGASLNGSACVFLRGHVGQGPIRYFLDGAFHRQENYPPWDFNGSNDSAGTCILFNFGALAVGSHSIRAARTGGEDTATFTVAAPPPPLPLPPPPPPPPPGSGDGVDAPVPPGQNYVIPPDAVAVSTTSQLTAALAGSNPNVVVENGTYVPGSALNLAGKNVYARNQGQVTFNAGVNLNGGDLYGVNVVILPGSPRSGFDSAVTPGGSTNGLHDVTIDGGMLAEFAFAGYSPNGLVLERVVASRAQSDCIRISDNQGASTAVIQRLTDIRASQCGDGHVAPGTGESALWVGHRVAEKVDRIDLSGANWMGLWTGNAARDTVFEDVNIHAIGPRATVGYYAEHDSVNITVREFRIDAPRAITHEWPAGSGTPSTFSPTYEDGIIERPGTACTVGVYFDNDSFTGTATIRRVTFEAGMAAAISNHLPAAGSQLVTAENIYNGNVVLNPGPHLSALC
jgi:hypothetical protein